MSSGQECRIAPAEYVEHLARRGFTIERHIGNGLSGNVYRAVQEGLHRPVAIKFCDTLDAKKDSRVRARFERESLLLARCQHPRIPYVVTRGVEPVTNVPYTIMEYISGQTLRSELEADGRFEPARALLAISQVLEALSCAHANDVIHRDVNPSNILSTPYGYMVIDFSIGADLDPTVLGVTGTGDALGIPEYAAPEQLKDASGVDARADVYTAGIVLLEMLTGLRRFPRQDPHTELSALPPELVDAIAISCAQDRDERYPNASAFLEALSPFYERVDIWQRNNLALCPNVACWDWDRWDGGTWHARYFDDTRDRHCHECGHALLRRCPKCAGALTRTKHCGACGEQLAAPPKCFACSRELDQENWFNGAHLEGGTCTSCRPMPRQSQDWDDEDIPF